MAKGPRARWRRRGAVLAVLVLLAAAGLVVADPRDWRFGVPSQDLFGDPPRPGSPAPDAATGSPAPGPGAELTGPLNILLVGVDTRVSQPGWRPNADAVLILHVPEPLDRAYLVSLPRDLIVDVPAFDEAGFAGGRYRLLSAMSYGSRVPGQQVPDTAQGFALLAETVSRYTGIEWFDAGAVLNFPGFADLVDAVGGVEIHLDLRVASEHRQPDGTHRSLRPGGGGYLGPQRVYEPGTHQLVGWEALDVARQRFLPGSDYTRQLHHRRLIQALVEQIVDQDLTDPIGLARVLRAVGDALIFDGRGYQVADFAYALRGLDAEAIVRVGPPGAGVYGAGAYLGERLEPVGEELLAAVRDDRVAAFLADHPELIDLR